LQRYGISLEVAYDQSYIVTVWPACRVGAKKSRDGNKDDSCDDHATDGYHNIIRGLDEHVSAEKILQRVVQAHTTHRFWEFIAAVKQNLAGKITAKQLDSELPSSAKEAADLERQRAAEEVARQAYFGKADKLLDVNAASLTCSVKIANYLFVYVPFKHSCDGNSLLPFL